MVMQENDETGHTISLDYTFTPTNALGVYVKHEENGKEFLMVTPEFNTLLKRWNLPDGQGNIFNMTGAGLAHYRGTISRVSGLRSWQTTSRAAGSSLRAAICLGRRY